MVNDFRMDNYNFICPYITTEGNENIAYVPQPMEAELKGIARILGSLFVMIKEGKLDMVVFLKDWEVYVDEICNSLDNGEVKRKALDAFLARSLLGAKFFTSEGDSISDPLNPEEEDSFKGALLFLSALFRYTPKQTLNSELQGFFTSLTLTEYQKSLRKPTDPYTVGVVEMNPV